MKANDIEPASGRRSSAMPHHRRRRKVLGLIIVVCGTLILLSVLRLLFCRDNANQVTTVHCRQTAAKSLAQSAIQPETNKSGSGNPQNSSSEATQSQQPVSIEFLRSVADRSMASVGAVNVAQQPVIGSDSTTQLVSFVYWVQQGDIAVPSMPDIARSAHAAIDEQKQAAKRMAVAAANNDDAAARVAAKTQIEASRKLAGEDAFMTLDLSMTKDNPPVIMFRKGLPLWIIFHDTARMAAFDTLRSDVSLSSVMQTTPVSAPILVFTDGAGRNAYVNLRPLQVHTSPPKTSPTQRALSYPGVTERTARVQAQWDYFAANGIDLSQFSLEGLIDLSNR